MVQPPQQEAPTPDPIPNPRPDHTAPVQHTPTPDNHCVICGKPILMMIYRGTHVCGINCEKIYNKHIQEARNVRSDPSIPG